MANAKFSTLGAQFTANAAAVATAAAGTVVTSDIQTLGAILTALATYRLDIMYEMLEIVSGPGGIQPATQLTPG